MKQARAERYRREHAVRLARLRAVADRPFAPRGVRVRLALGYLGAVAVMLTVQLVSDARWTTIAALGMYAVVLVLWFALRRATRLVTEAPDEVLDELFVRLRNGFYRDAYPLLSVVTMLLVGLLLLQNRVPELAGRIADALPLPVIALATGLPAIVAAFRLPDLDESDVAVTTPDSPPTPRS